jgi:chemotaxis protein CheD
MTAATEKKVQTTLSLGEWAVTGDAEALLTCVGLGSCVAVVMFDPQARVGGMAHMVLPDSTAGRGGPAGAKFVDVAVPLLHKTMKEQGAVAQRTRVYLAGGSQMLQSVVPAGSVNIGQRNADAAHEQVKKLGLRVNAEHLGGNRGRTVRLDVGTGRVTVAIPGDAEIEL